MEDFNVLNDTQETVVESQETEATTSEVTETEETQVETAPVVEEAQPRQSAEENARFAAARRQAEAEAEALKAQNDRLMQALGQYGYQGDPDTIADALFAQSQGISVEEATAQRQAAEAENAKYTQLQSQLEYSNGLAKKYLLEQDLRKIQAVYPEAKMEDLEGQFMAAINVTQDPLLAYATIQQLKEKTVKPTPPNIGAVNSSSSKEKDFYTPDEVDKLTSKDYDNPKIMERVRASMLKWK